MNGLANEIKQRMLQGGAYDVPIRDVELHWRKMLHSSDTLLEDFISWGRRCGWAATMKDKVVQLRR